MYTNTYKLTLNIQKTVCILFQKPGSNKTIQIRIENITIHNTTETSFLAYGWMRTVNGTLTYKNYH